MECIVRPRRRRATTTVLAFACCYLLHFHTRLKHAGHYLGATKDLLRRLAEHEHGHGSKYMRAVVLAGITWELADTFEPAPGQTIWELERELKGDPRGKGSKGSWARYCSICKGLKQETKPDYTIPLQLDPLRPRKKLYLPEESLPF
jgi:predicted GIY-YIG superfamily endonuclease